MLDTISLTGKRWCVSDTTFVNASHVLAHIVNARNIDLHRAPALTHPKVFPDIKKAQALIETALERKKRIGLFGDYDCDGITAVAQLVRFCKRHGTEPWVRLPHRVHDGYGLHSGIVKEMRDAEVDLLITADTGITAVREIALLQENGIDVIVTDHHRVQEEIPQAKAIIHPECSSYPLPHPSGAGVVFQLICALENGSWKGMNQDITLAMFGTVADLVPLQGDNRALTQLGLQAWNTLQSGPLAELRESVRTSDAALRSSDVAYRIAPRINAAGRMGDPYRALTALLEGGDAITELTEINLNRQEQTHMLVTQAIDSFSQEDLPNLLCICKPNLPHGLLGLIAGRLTEAFGRPSLIAVTDGEKCTASLRSPACYNITEGLMRCSNLLTGFGGHSQAAGCVFPLKNLELLQEHFERDIAKKTDTHDLVSRISLDGIIDPAHITKNFCDTLSALEPFGQHNPEPRFLMQGVTLENRRTVGSDGQHLQATIAGIKSIGFGLGNLSTRCDGQLDVAVRVEMNTWKGVNQPQCIIEDLRLSRNTQYVPRNTYTEHERKPEVSAEI